MVDITSTQIYDEIIKNRTEIKNKIETSEAKLLMKVEELTNKLKQVQTENCMLKEQIETLTRNSKKNNFLIFGLKQQPTEVTSDYICQKIKHRLNVDVTETDLNDFYTLGNSKNSPIKVELISHLKKKTIARNWHKLKGSNITIAHDLTPQQRTENKILRKHLQLAKQDGKICYIKKNRLHVNNETYCAEDLFELENQKENSECKPNSIPATPIPLNDDTFPIAQKGNVDKNTTEKGQTPKIGITKTGTIKKTESKLSERTRKRTVN
ncbi:hypothetical protein NQ314_013483 [Rhamnusium bicolor]|uniref:Endonuclease-reverse transcriptase n=1 Tax=Rhamnusium bicolor TaxID=1586634 RepID=A0AAV8X663_9CUCU|nr:hypothetical protein NQ314_013483 [Rhamnusium bicolor]